MLKKLLLKINIQLKKLFKKKPEGTEAPEPIAQTKHIKKVNQLKKELNQLIHGYNASIRKLNFMYDRKNHDYQNKYNEYQIAYKKYKNGVISEDDLKQVKQSLEPLKESTEDVGHELQKVESFKKDDVINLVGDIEAIQEDYIKEIASQLEEDASELQELKRQYLTKINSIGAKYQTVIDTKNLINNSMKSYNYNYDSKLIEMLDSVVPLKQNDLLIDDTLINKALKKPLQ